jgi:hypothetical protein
VTPAEALAAAKKHGVEVRLTPLGDGVEVSSKANLPLEIRDLLKNMKAELIAHLQTERGRINHWIAHQIIDWDPNFCRHCKQRIFGQRRIDWIEITNGEATMRIHVACEPQWRLEMETAARKAVGIP